MPDIDQRLLTFLEANRAAVLHLLRADQSHPPTAEDMSLGLQTLKTGADTMLRLVENAGVVVEKERLWAERSKIEAASHSLLLEKERVYAERDRIRAEMEKSKVDKFNGADWMRGGGDCIKVGEL